MRTGAVVTTYHPGLRLQRLLRAVSPQIQHVTGPLRLTTAVAVTRGLLDARRGRIDQRCLPAAVEQVAR